MTTNRLEIVWRGLFVGYMQAPIDDFPHVYGRWASAGTNASRAFEAILNTADADGLRVTIRGMDGTAVMDLDDRGSPSGFINVRISHTP